MFVFVQDLVSKSRVQDGQVEAMVGSRRVVIGCGFPDKGVKAGRMQWGTVHGEAGVLPPPS